MRFNVVIPTLILAGSSYAAAQGVPASVSAKVESDLLAQLETVIANPSVKALISDLAADVPSSILVAIQTQQPRLTDLSALATNPNVYLTGRPTAWETALPSSVRSAYDAYQTSLAYAQASVIASDLGISVSAGSSSMVTTATSVSGSMSTTGSASAAAQSTGAAVAVGAQAVWGVAAGVVGVAGFVAAVL